MNPAEIFTLFDQNVLRSGCTETTAHDGGVALYFDNTAGQSAKDKITLTGSALGADDFTLRLWLKTDRNGCNGWCGDPADYLGYCDFVDRAAQTPGQLAHGGVLCANCVFDGAYRPGLSVAVLQPRAFLTVNFMPEDADKPVQFGSVRPVCDGRWHMIVLTADRAGLLRLYVDGQVYREAVISQWQGLSLGDQPLTVGADANGAFGLGPDTLADFALEQGVMSEAEVARRYYVGATSQLACEIAGRKLDQGPIYNPAAAQKLLSHARWLAEQAQTSENPMALYRMLREEYEAFLLKTNQPDLKLFLISDEHCDGDDGLRTLTTRRAYRWAQELGMDAVIDGGDYSFFGKDFELDSYWHMIEDEWADKPLFVTVGNHETLELKCNELVRYHCDHLHQHGMVPADYSKLFYEGEVNGCHVIVLAQYSDTYTVTGYKGMWIHAGEIKPEQIDYLRERLDRYCGQGKPVFLVIHNSVRKLLDRQSQGNYREHSVIIRENGLYDVLRSHPDVVLCTGHVHHGFGGGAGINYLEDERYTVIDMPGVRGCAYGYGPNEKDAPGLCHCGCFVYVFGKTLLLRAFDYAKHEWLTAYDQVFTLPD